MDATGARAEAAAAAARRYADRDLGWHGHVVWLSADDAERLARNGSPYEQNASFRERRMLCRWHLLRARAPRLHAVLRRVWPVARWTMAGASVAGSVALSIVIIWSPGPTPTPVGVRMLLAALWLGCVAAILGPRQVRAVMAAGLWGMLLVLLPVVLAARLASTELAWPLRVVGDVVLATLTIGVLAGLYLLEIMAYKAALERDIRGGPQLRVGTERLAGAPRSSRPPAAADTGTNSDAAGPPRDWATGLHCWSWLPYRGLTVLVPVPDVVHAEWVGGRPRLHCPDGPALRWADGSEQHWWHGVRVPAVLFGDDWSPHSIRKLTNTELRRAAIEIVGWPEFLRRARVRPIATAPDPGNPGHELTLYDVPHDVGGGRQRLLVMANGSPDRDGRPRFYAESVPAHIRDPVAAAAWQYGVPVETYRLLQRRT